MIPFTSYKNLSSWKWRHPWYLEQRRREFLPVEIVNDIQKLMFDQLEELGK